MIHMFGRWILYFSLFALAAAVVFSTISPLLYFLPLMNLLAPTYGHNHVVDILLFVLPIALSFSIKEKKYFVVAGVLLSGVVFSFARAAMVLAAGMVLMFYFFSKKRMSAAYRSIFILLSLFVVSLFLLALLMIDTQAKKIADHLPVASRIEKESLVKNTRFEYWRQAITAIGERPLFGSGPGTFYLQSKRLQNSPNVYSWFAHNFVLEWLVEVGVVGTTLLGALLGWCVRHASKKQALFYSVLVILIYGLVDYLLNYLVIWFLLWAAIGVLIGVNSNVKKSSINSDAPRVIGFIILLMFYLITIFGYLGWKPAKLISEGEVAQVLDTKKIDANLALVLHKNNPDTLFAFAKNHELSNATKQGNFLKKVVGLDPYNNEYNIQYLQVLFEEMRFNEFGKSLDQYLKKISSQAQYASIRFDNPILIENYSRIYFPDYILSYNNHSLGLSIVLYLMGLDAVWEDPFLTERLWIMARDNSPEWSYFHIELASLAKQELYNLKKSRDYLDYCAQYQAPKEHCQSITTETVGVVGSFKEVIEQSIAL